MYMQLCLLISRHRHRCGYRRGYREINADINNNRPDYVFGKLFMVLAVYIASY